MDAAVYDGGSRRVTCAWGVYDICGNICETGDRFAEQRELPEIREYDLLDIENAGAYCYSMGSIYNLRAMPGEIVVSQGKVVSLRKAESEEAMLDRVLKEDLNN